MKNKQKSINSLIALTQEYDTLPQSLVSKVSINGTMFNGIWDTGSAVTAVSESVARKLGLVSLGAVPQNTANGTRLANNYLINISIIMGNKGMFFDDVSVLDANMNSVDMLIGMDIITKGDFAIRTCDGKTIMSFAVGG